MTKYHLNYWSKGDLTRIYVNDDARNSLGYFEERIRTAARGSSSYYDRHRLAKGDTEVELGREYTCTLPADAAAKIYAAPAIAENMKAAGLVDDCQKFRSLSVHARGYSRHLIATKAKKTAQKNREETFWIEL